MKTKNLVKVVLASLLLMACETKPSDETSVPSSVETVEKFSSVKDAVNYLVNAKNYTINVHENCAGSQYDNQIFFTEKGYYDNYKNYEIGYIEFDEGIVKFDYYKEQMTVSEYLCDEENNRYSDLWNSKLFYSLNGLEVGNFTDATGTTYTKKNKLDILCIFRLVSIDTQDYLNLSSFSMTTENESYLTIEITMNNTDYYKLDVVDINKTVISEIDTYRNSGKKAFEPYITLKNFRDLFMLKNYKHVFYDETGKNEMGWEHYTEQYFYGCWDEKYKTSGTMLFDIGCVGIENSKLRIGEDQYTDVLNGTYYLFVTNGTVSILTQSFVNVDSDVTRVYNYPTYMSLFSNLQYFEETKPNVFETQKGDIILDFLYNFQLMDQLAEAGAAYSKLEVMINYNEANPSESVVTFNIYYVISNTTMYSSFVFKDFGTSNIPVIDEYLASNLVKVEA